MNHDEIKSYIINWHYVFCKLQKLQNFLMLHNEKRAVHNITVYCEERYAERKNKEKSCYTDFQETDFRVLAQGGQRNDEN